MKIFITGGTGYIGSAVAAAVAEAGHEPVLLAHHDDAVRSFTEKGYQPVKGDLRDAEGLGRLADDADAVIHTANTGGEDAGAVDEAAVRALVGALAGSEKPFVYTSGVWVLGDTGGEVAHEDSPTDPADLVAWRAEVEEWLVDAADRGVRTSVLRPGIVYGRGGGIPAMMARGELPVVGDGSQHWPVVHVDDLAALYVAAVGRAPAGSILHGIADEVTPRELAEEIVPGEASFVSLEEARQAMGPFADALALDQRVSSEKTRELLGWDPERPSILEARDTVGRSDA